MVKKIALVLVAFIGCTLGGCTSSQVDQQTNTSPSIIKSTAKTQSANPTDKPQETIKSLETPNKSEGKNDGLSQQENSFSDEDIEVFKLIQKYYKEFNYSNTYTNTNDSKKKMVFAKNNNLYFDFYISYDMIFDSDNKILNYFFDAGTADRGYGSYYVIDDNTVIKIEKSVGTSAYSYEIYKNGKKIDGDSKSYNMD